MAHVIVISGSLRCSFIIAITMLWECYRVGRIQFRLWVEAFAFTCLGLERCGPGLNGSGFIRSMFACKPRG